LTYHVQDEYIHVTSFDTPQNPNDLHFEEYDIVKNNGVNRISLGPQLGNMGALLQTQQPQHQRQRR
jgi:coproporphyrinogen III oxidase-like Fe-S oxidoreductase